MTTDKDIDIFINWLVDNDYFNEFINNFKVENTINKNVFFELKKQLKETNVKDFVNVLYKNEERSKEWNDYYEFRYCPNQKIIPHKGSYIAYNVTRYGVTCKYISIVDYHEVCAGDTYIYEICSLCVKSDDEELVDTLDYDMEFCLSESEGVTGFRMATPEEINYLNSFLKEDGLMFDAKINKIVNL